MSNEPNQIVSVNPKRSQEEHFAEILNAIGDGIDAMRRLVGSIRSYERDGYSIDELQQRLAKAGFCGVNFDMLRLVAHGQLDETLAWRLDGTTVLKIVKSLPLPEQKQMAEGRKYRIVKYNKEGIQVIEEKRVEDMSPQDARQVFHNSRVNTENEQISLLYSKYTHSKKTPKGKMSPAIAVDVRRKVIHVNEPMTLTLKELSKYVLELQQ